MKLKAPNVLVLICSILTLMAVLTWIIPAGSYDRKKVKIKGVGEKEVVVPGTFQSPPQPANAKQQQAIIERVLDAGVKAGTITKEERQVVRGPKTKDKKPQDPWDLVKAPIAGFGYHKAWEIIGFILLVGGAFGVLNKTGAIMAFLTWLVDKAGNAGRFVMVPILMFTFSAGGAIFGMAEESIAFVMITVPLAVAMRFDVITGIAIPFVGSQAGFATAYINPFTVGIAKGIAVLPMDDGFWYRFFCWFLITTLCCLLVTWHAYRVAKDPQKSLSPKLDEEWRKSLVGGEGGKNAKLRSRDLWVVILFLLSMVMLAYGALELDWYITEMSAIFLVMCLICGLGGRLKLGEMADAFMEGAKDLAPTAILLAFARAILLTAQQGGIVDPILHWVSEAMKGLGPTAATECMFAVQTCINFFVPSGSSQAALTMPIMAPLAQLLGVHGENAVLAYQFGDGFTNMIIPTNPVLIGVVSVARLSYGTWFAWMWKFQVLLFLVGMVLLAFSPFS